MPEPVLSPCNGWTEMLILLICPFLSAIAEVYKNEGKKEILKKEFNNAIDLYTKGIKVNCEDAALNAKLYTNRATAHFYLGKIQ